MGEFDAAGEIVTGALLGRAVERDTGAHSGHGGQCLNCGTTLLGGHCHRCGQKDHVHRSLGEVWHEILHGVVHFDGKLWRTLPLLAWRPGELTRRYIEGERARFVSPMALFLFSLFTMFAVFQIAGIAPPADLKSGYQVASGMQDAGKRLKETREEAVAKRDAMAAGSLERAEADREIAELDEAVAALDGLATQVGDSDIKFTTAVTGWERLDHGIEKANKNPGLALYKLQSNGYKFSWLLIPLSLPFVWLMFAWKRKYKAYDHAVFITYSIAFMSLLFIVLTVASSLGVATGVIAAAAVFIPPVHIYKHLKGAYQLRRISALLRTLLLLFFVLLVLILFLLVLLLLGFIG